jgi:hypothetical protein
MLHTVRFFFSSSKCRLFHNATFFVPVLSAFYIQGVLKFNPSLPFVSYIIQYTYFHIFLKGRWRIFIAFGNGKMLKHITPRYRVRINFRKTILRATYFRARGSNSNRGYVNFWPKKHLASLADVSAGCVRRQGPVKCSVPPGNQSLPFLHDSIFNLNFFLLTDSSATTLSAPRVL